MARAGLKRLDEHKDVPESKVIGAVEELAQKISLADVLECLAALLKRVA
jgi:hypothetical protein